ncbi:glycosyltransferase family 4 protein [Microseira wollei]|uniref:Glycosyl transferase, group 1 n=1 Tax=Microseira wollei NIES-4236 TaxID=2530354 RepID=A0AAV3XUC8_9CYAN|nr:glycosyltransferase family 4 protein [Microseira wollei]GET44052.1 glycosyl transferase, group 1 [Microseira wollei NIES-4236]
MSKPTPKVLLVIEQCNPDWASVPLVGYNYYKEISKLVDATLVTHERNKQAIQNQKKHEKVVYTRESKFSKIYHNFVANIANRGRFNWPLYNALNYLIYAEFNHQVYEQFKDQVFRGDYDLVHAITPMMPRYAVKIVKACKKTPFLIGPVNGGVPFPAGFQDIAKQEFAYLNFLRAVGRFLIPGYRETYKKADKILAGSTFTLNMLKELFSLPDDKISLFYENGISSSFLDAQPTPKDNNKVNLLFVGRLVPYKGADMLIEAIGKLEGSIKEKILVKIVGDGSEKGSLEAKVQKLNLGEIVKFTGWVNQEETLVYYRKSDIFCFPSIREFGGAVVLEAMACGLPCIVANNGGIGEYVTEETGFKIEPISRDYLTQELTQKIHILVENEELRQKMSAKSIERVREFTWSEKAKKIVEIYHLMINN